MLSVLLATVLAAGVADPPLIMFDGVTTDGRNIAFGYAGDIWAVPLEGGEAQAIIADPADEALPRYSPDGRSLAFSRMQGGDWDVFVTAEGGDIVRLTWHPKRDLVRGWTPESTRVLISTARDGDGLQRLYTVARTADWPRPLPLPQAVRGAFSPDGESFAYNPVGWEFDIGQYVHYRGGMTSPLWLASLEDSGVTEIAGNDSNHFDPRWIGETIYYIGDESGVYNLYAYDTNASETEQLTDFDDHGVLWSDATEAGVVFVQGGRIHFYDAGSGETRIVPVTVSVDGGALQKRTADAADYLQSARLSPDATQLAVEARGEIFTYNLDEKSAQWLTQTSDTAERDPALSPDGSRVAYFSDAGGEYALYIQPANGGEARRIEIEPSPAFYRNIHWSPTGTHLVFTGKRLGLWLVAVDTGEVKRVAQSDYLAQEDFQPAWHPSGRYVAYALGHSNHLRDIVIYDVESDEHVAITSNFHASSPVFDPNGKYLYYIGSNLAPHAAANDIWGLLSAIQIGPLVTGKIHLAILQDNTPAPFYPATGRPNRDADVRDATDKPIDFDGLSKRIVPLDLPERNYTALGVGGAGELYFTFRSWPESPNPAAPTTQPLHYFDLGSGRRDIELVGNVEAFQPSAASKKLIYNVGQGVYQLDTSERDAKPEPVAFDDVTVAVDPKSEWRQMYDEVWRLMRDYFYDHGHHGEDLAALKAHYAKFLPTVTRRADLNRLFEFMLGHVAISHLVIGGGDMASEAGSNARIGVLGAEFSVQDNRYRIDHIYRRAAANGTNGLALAAPLDQPGVDVREGDFILAIGGKAVDASQNLYAYLAGTANKPIEIEVASDAQGGDRRTATIVPLIGDNGLQRSDWFDRNAEVVREKTEGRVLYVPIAGFGGDIEGVFAAFASASEYDGVIVDQRYNGGGITSDVLIQMLTRDRYHHYAFPYGAPLTVPTTLVPGTKVLITNETNFSAAETFPLMWQLAKVGPIVGKRTGGGGTGTALHYPRLIDGGVVRIPNRAGYNPKTGDWLENRGVTPDIEVELDPAAWREGRDAQLEAAIDTVLNEIENAPKEQLHEPEPMVHP